MIDLEVWNSDLPRSIFRSLNVAGRIYAQVVRTNESSECQRKNKTLNVNSQKWSMWILFLAEYYHNNTMIWYNMFHVPFWCPLFDSRSWISMDFICRVHVAKLMCFGTALNRLRWRFALKICRVVRLSGEWVMFCVVLVVVSVSARSTPAPNPWSNLGKHVC